MWIAPTLETTAFSTLVLSVKQIQDLVTTHHGDMQALVISLVMLCRNFSQTLITFKTKIGDGEFFTPLTRTAWTFDADGSENLE